MTTATAYASKALADECAAIAATGPGARNHRLNQAGFSVGQLVGAGALSRDEAEVALIDAGVQAGLGEMEARITAISGLNAGQQQPRAGAGRGNGAPPVKSTTKPANTIWKSVAQAKRAFEGLPLARDDQEAVAFLAGDYGLAQPSVPSEWRVFVYGKHGRGIVYQGRNRGGEFVYKWRGFTRNDKGKRPSAFLFGGEGALVIDGAAGGLLVITGGEEKQAAIAAAGVGSFGLLTGEHASDDEWIKGVVEAGPECYVLAFDHDDAGRTARDEAARRLRKAGIAASRIKAVAWPVDAPEGFDANDLVKAGGIEALRAAILDAPIWADSTAPKTMSAAALAVAILPPMLWIVEGYRPVGLTVIASRPKRGKSWLELLTAVCVASGRALFGQFAVTAGWALYLALEDSAARMKRRLEILGVGHPEVLEIAFDWPRIGKGGLEAFEAWLQAHVGARSIIIDTWPRIKPARQRNADPYEHDYEARAMMQALAIKHGVAVVLILHQRKAPDGDVFLTVSGSTANTAAADVIAVLQRKGSRGTLAVTGRDLEERTLSLAFADGLWTYQGDAPEPEDERMNATARAKEFLAEFLAHGQPRPSDEIFTAARERGIGKNSVYDAKDQLGIRASKAGSTGKWNWSLPR
ncbi:MAG: AAA family ATPase [Candidatus Sumerlaeota bacterium]|nr:AAA family ATPase [Candidatus Sumerlaeota bacterium]